MDIFFNNRFLKDKVLEDLNNKMVFIGGPRQVGKTTLSRDIIASNYFSTFRYYNWDSRQDRQQILNEQWTDAELIIFDEIHKYKKWKTLVKGAFDKKQPYQKIMVTGSARLDVYRKGGDSLQGRYHYYKLHPFSVSEVHQHIPTIEPFKPLSFSKLNSVQTVSDLLLFGGFPEPFLKKSIRHLRRWHLEKVERLFREDIRDISSVQDIDSMQLLADILPDRVASLLSINSIREDLEVSHRSVTQWISILEALYYSYRVYPYQSNRIRALKKDAKLFLWDWSEVNNEGAKFENLIAGHLLKTVHFLRDYEGYNCSLYYLRDKDKREVDFIVTVNETPWFCVEVKLSKTDIPTSLSYFKDRLNIPFSYIVTREEIAGFIKNDVHVLPASLFLTGLL